MHKTLLATMLALVGACLFAAWSWAQPLGDVPRALDRERTRISDERVTRQTEVIRLEQMIDRLADRVTRLERLLMASSRLPLVTVMEAEAEVQFAEERLKETTSLHAADKASASEVTGAKLDVVRARAQLDVARTSQQEHIVDLEMEVLQRQQLLLEEQQKVRQLERLVSKGIGSSEGLELQRLEVDEAQKQLERAKMRLALQRQLADEDQPDPSLD